MVVAKGKSLYLAVNSSQKSGLPLCAGRDILLGMTTPLLVITDDIPFGKLLHQNLSETGRFTVHVAAEVRSAVSFYKDTNCSMAFLDTSLGAAALLKLGAALRSVNAKMRFVIVSEADSHPDLDELSPEDYLAKPYYLPDLLEMMQRLFHPSKEATTLPVKVDEDSRPHWLSDATRAAQHLTRLTLESSAQAALILKNDELWSYAGQLPQSATSELTSTIARYWDHQEESDLARFVRLVSTDAEHMLYATRLAPNTILALVFDAETSFSTIRSQASKWVHSFSASAPAPEKGTPAEKSDQEVSLSSFSNILSDIPSPNPAPSIPSIQSGRLETNPAIPLPVASIHKFSRESSPATPLKLPGMVEEAKPVPPESIEQTLKSAVITSKSKGRKNEPTPESIAETRPSSPGEVARRITLEPTSPAVYNLDYACLLIPRFVHHHITGDLAEHMGEWVPQICIAFGWRLEYISVRPDYLQWIANVPPATSPSYLMRILRQHTSEKIFAEFPRLKKDNPSGDFWAPGYLIMGGAQPPPAQLIKDFLIQTRRRQGITQPTK